MAPSERPEALIEAARAGWCHDRRALEVLFERCRDRFLDAIRARGRSLAAGQEPEDVLQETFLRATESIARFEDRGEESFLRWLHGIARNVELEGARRPRETLSLEAAERAESQDPSPSRGLRREERRERLERAIASLPDHYREVVRLARIEGLKVREVAARLGKSPDATKHILARALRLLRGRMGDTDSLGLPEERGEAPEGRHGD
ncbi:MAG: sigma-70 family RNA polymerase sigma factor [Planctomycetes bacterium]|nr:sigma-70 family RNA polymerase sigma factor [Planctomycetota bacterium]